MQAPLSKQQVPGAEPASTERRCEKEGTPRFWGHPQDYGTGPERDGRNTGPESCLHKNRPAPGHLPVCPPHPSQRTAQPLKPPTRDGKDCQEGYSITATNSASGCNDPLRRAGRFSQMRPQSSAPASFRRPPSTLGFRGPRRVASGSL